MRREGSPACHCRPTAAGDCSAALAPNLVPPHAAAVVCAAVAAGGPVAGAAMRHAAGQTDAVQAA